MTERTTVRAQDVSVVVPTRGRPASVMLAVVSVLDQTEPVGEVVVVVDGPDEATCLALDAVRDPRLRVLRLSRSGGPAAARNAGVAVARRPWIAFLDDDDSWSPTKLAEQCSWLSQALSPEDVVLGTGVVWRTGDTDLHWPRRGPATGEAVADYLFVRDAPGEGFLATPTLLLSRRLAVATPMPEHLRLHEDFDWFLDLEEAGARFEVLLRPLVLVDGAAGRDSLSRTSRWQESLAWCHGRRQRLGPRAFSAFCLTEVARRARSEHAYAAAPRILLTALTGRPRAKDLARFLAIWVIPERLRWRLGAVRGRAA